MQTQIQVRFNRNERAALRRIANAIRPEHHEVLKLSATDVRNLALVGALSAEIEPRMHDRTVRAVFKSINQLGGADDPVMKSMGVDAATCETLLGLHCALERVMEARGW